MKWHSPHKNRKSAKNRNDRNLPRKIKKNIKRIPLRDNKIEISTITIKPLERFPEFFKDSHKIIMKPTFDAINNFLKGNKYAVNLTYESLYDGKQTAKFPLKIKQSNHKGVNFEINLPNNFICKGIKDKENYGLGDSLKVYNDRDSYFIERGCITNFETTFPHKPLLVKGSFTHIQTFEKLKAPTYVRCIIPTNDKNMIFPGYFLNCVPKCILFDIDSLSLHSDSIIGIPMPSTKGYYSELNINGCNILFYGIEVKNNCCLVIDSLDKIHINDFERIVYAIRLVYAFFTGRFYKEEKITLTSSERMFDIIENLSYQMEDESIITNYQIIDFELFRQLADEEKDLSLKDKYNKYRKGVKVEVFSTLCNVILSTKDFKRVFELIASAGRNNNPVIQGAIYSVALETLTQIIYDENAETLVPMQRELFREMQTKFIDIFSSYEDKMDERGKSIIKAKIQNINSPTNRDKLERPFEVIGITLTEEERKTIGSRNQYLHGGEPESSYDCFLTAQLKALNLFDLTARLILKYAKYEGHYFSPQFKYVLNNETARDIINNKEIDIVKYNDIVRKLKKEEFSTLKEIQDAKEFLAEFIPYIGLLSILGQKVQLI